MDFLKGGSSPPSEALLPVNAGEKTADGQTTLDNQQRPSTVGKMTYARRTITVLLVCMLLLLGVSSASPWMPCHKRATDQQTSESTSFSAKVKAASPASLHDLLHRYLPDRFRDGVFESDHKAMEAIHQEDPALATSILKLARRDDTNATATSSSPPPTESTSVPPTKPQTSEPPSETTTSTHPPSSTIIPPSSTSASIKPPSTSTSVPPPTSSSESSIPTSTPSSSPSGTSSSLSEPTFSPTSSSSGPGTSPSSSRQTLPSSSILGETTLTTTTRSPATTTPPPVSSKATTETFTSTSPNGVVVVVTRTNYVPADAGETQAPSSTGVGGTLQNSAVRRFSGGSTLACVVGVAVLLMVI